MQTERVDAAAYDETRIKNVYLGLKGKDRGKYFILTPTGMTPARAKIGSPEFEAEVKEKAAKVSGIATVSVSMKNALCDALKRAKTRDRDKGRKCDIDEEFIIQLYERQKGCCALTGIPISVNEDLASDNPRSAFGPSIDRINNRRGYEPDNVQITLVIANIAKSDFADVDFFRMCAETTLRKGLLISSV